MADLWLKIKIWTKIIVATLALLYVIVFSVTNSGQQATFWYFVNVPPVTTSTLKLVLIAFGSGVTVAVLARAAFRTVGQIRELRDRQAAGRRERDAADLRTKAGMLRSKPDPDAPRGEPTVPPVA